MNFSQGRWFQLRFGSAKCAACKGKGWHDDHPEPVSATGAEEQIVIDVLKQNKNGLNIDDIARFTGMDVPKAYRILLSLKDNGDVRIESGSPVIYYLS
jgi:transcriptional regulator TrmB